MPLNELPTRQQISEKYLEIILKVLSKINYWKDSGSKGGGYRLTRPINEYTAGEILELTEGSLFRCLPCTRMRPV